MGKSLYVSLCPPIVLSTLSRVLSLVGTIVNVPSIPYAAVYFLKFSSNVSSAFKYSIPGAGKGDAGNGLLIALASSMADFVARCFDDNDVNCYCFGKNPLCHLRALLSSW